MGLNSQDWNVLVQQQIRLLSFSFFQVPFSIIFSFQFLNLLFISFFSSFFLPFLFFSFLSHTEPVIYGTEVRSFSETSERVLLEVDLLLWSIISYLTVSKASWSRQRHDGEAVWQKMWQRHHKPEQMKNSQRFWWCWPRLTDHRQ